MNNRDLAHIRHSLLPHPPFRATCSAMKLNRPHHKHLSHMDQIQVFLSLLLAALQPHLSLLIPVNDHTPLLPSLLRLHCTGVLHAQLHTHRSLVLRSSLVGELGSKWESSGGSSFPCASSQARSSRSFLLLARSAAGRGDKQKKPFSAPCQQHLAEKTQAAPAALKNSLQRSRGAENTVHHKHTSSFSLD